MIRRWILPVVALGLFASACGGDSGNDPFEQAGAAATDVTSGDSNNSSEGETGQSSPEGIDIPEGMPTSDGLIPELAGLPVPPNVVFSVGSANPADVDPRETAVQQVFFVISAEQVAEFYLDELPAAGYEIDDAGGGITEKSEIVAGQGAFISFITPDGLPGQVNISPSQLAASQMNINVFRSGTR